jgi:hypothetical protein
MRPLSQASWLSIQVKRHDHVAVGQALLPDTASFGQRDREAVTETAHALERAEIMVERAVFLHQDHDVLDVADGAGRIIGRDGQGALDGRWKGGKRAGCDTCARTIAQETAS